MEGLLLFFSSMKGGYGVKHWYERRGEYLIIRPEGDLDHHVAEEIRVQADELMDLYRISHVIFDFSDITFMDSSGVGVIMGRYRKVLYVGGSVSIVGMSERVEKIFRMSGLSRITRQYEKIEEVIERGKR